MGTCVCLRFWTISQTDVSQYNIEKSVFSVCECIDKFSMTQGRMENDMANRAAVCLQR